MKINILSIVGDHLATLYDSRNNRVSIFDICLFYILPFIAALIAFYCGLSLRPEAYNISITFFGIFIALILNIQVAMFSIFQKKWDLPSDARLAESLKKTLDARKQLLTELNSNLSYLILVCCFALVVSLVTFVKSYGEGFVPSLLLFVYAHFILTLLMIIKRAHALFHKEYRDAAV
jgi:hydrogenase-4 membrane subunit HyfE